HTLYMMCIKTNKYSSSVALDEVFVCHFAMLPNCWRGNLTVNCKCNPKQSYLRFSRRDLMIFGLTLFSQRSSKHKVIHSGICILSIRLSEL
uniref:Uncharacterized protein n=2 Tax=Cyprinus carpio TaxID=7962 RepID=A0A8C1C0J5_CYPCA